MVTFSLFILLLLQMRIEKTESVTMENVKAIWNRYKMVTQGDSTYYGKYPGGGACALDPPSPVNSQPGWIMVAAGQYDYQKSVGCGMCIEITANGEQTSPETGGPTPMKGTYKAYIVDLCGGCNQAGFDLYIGGYGKYKTSFKAVSCPSVPGQQGNIQFRFTGSNPWSIKLQARNSKVVTVGMEIEHNNKWVCMEKTDDNYFSINGLGEIKFPKRFRLTSISGEQLVSTVPGIANNENIATDIQYSDFNPDSNPENIKCFGQAGKTEQPIGPNTGPSPTAGTNPEPSSVGTLKPSGSPAPPGPAPSTLPPSQPAGEDKTFCKGKATGLYADPKDCGSFYQCASGITYWKHCPKGLHFNPKIQVCDYPQSANCKIEVV